MKGDAAAADVEETGNDEAPEVDTGPARPRALNGKSIGRVKQTTAPGPTVKGKSIGRRPPPGAGASPGSAPVGKSIGGATIKPATTSHGGVTRALVREKVSARLGKTLTPEEFALWARGQWASIQRGTPTEEGHKEKLEEVLLLLSTSAKATDHVILAYAAKLES